MTVAELLEHLRMGDISATISEVDQTGTAALIAQALKACQASARIGVKAKVAAFTMVASLARSGVTIPASALDVLRLALQPGVNYRQASADWLETPEGAILFALKLIAYVRRKRRSDIHARRAALDLLRFNAESDWPFLSFADVCAFGIALGVLDPLSGRPLTSALSVALKVRKQPEKMIIAAKSDGIARATIGRRLTQERHEYEMDPECLRDADFMRAFRNARASDTYREIERRAELDAPETLNKMAGDYWREYNQVSGRALGLRAGAYEER